ncbi:hypothetical protein IQ277_12215 [Nostocales cyanobacterium LEGE 12452]|nr:hypothetical protein [Nostocales cyanobacterium LEGE 12452]
MSQIRLYLDEDSVEKSLIKAFCNANLDVVTVADVSRNSIKESVSAVESLAKAITRKPKATLADALKVLEVFHNLHPTLKKSFLTLYGYTSDEGGIRHAMLTEPDLTIADAKFFLLSCTSFINYLKSKI